MRSVTTSDADSPRKRFTWLHLSDWHQKGEDQDRSVVANALIKDLTNRSAISPDLERVDAVFFTGDLANTGVKAEYDLARKLVLDPVLETLGLEKDRLFIIPGNHDLDRKRFRLLPEGLKKPFESHIEALEWFSSEEDRIELVKPFRDYEAFVKEYASAGFPALGEARIIDVGGYRVGIVGANSGLMCGRNLDRKDDVNDLGYLTVSEQQVIRPLETIESCDLRIGLIHHPFDWLRDYDRALVEQRMIAGSDLVLRGHVHIPDVQILESSDGKAVIVPSGSLWDGRLPSEPRYANGFNLGTVDLSTGKGCIYLRRWAAKNTEWKRDDETYTGGKKTIKLGRLAATRSRPTGRISSDSVPEIQTAYLEFIGRRCASVDPRGISQTVTQVSLPLDQVYVSLSAMQDAEGAVVIDPRHESERDEKAKSESNDEVRRLTDQPLIQQIVDLPVVLNQSRRTVILGDPGAGKSTLMRFLAAIHARAIRENRTQVLDGEGNVYDAPSLPVLLRIGDFALALAKEPNLDLLTFACTAQGECGHSQPKLRALLSSWLTKEQALFLLDGLDEIVDPGVRARVGERIRAFCDGVGKGAKVIVTSRIAGYREASLGGGFETFTLRDMDREQIEKFLSRWCVAVERKLAPHATEDEVRRVARVQIDGLLGSVDKNEGVRRLARNPLLLTILALIHRQGKQLPRRRVELYKIAVQTLLRDWQVDRNQADGSQLTEWEEQFLLEPLAYHMHTYFDNGLIPETEARMFLRQEMSRALGQPEISPNIHRKVDEFLSLVQKHTGVFVERAPEKYGFMHLTFEEYFAARHLMRDPTEAILRIHALRHQARWEEPIRLAIADQSPEFATKLIVGAILGRAVTDGSEALGSSELEEVLHRDFFLAIRCYGDTVGCSAKLERELCLRQMELTLSNSGGLSQVALSHLSGLADTALGQVIRGELLRNLQDEDSNFRGSAASALGALGMKERAIADALIKKLQDEDSDVRRSAASALGALGMKERSIADALVKKLQDKDWSVRRRAASALGALGMKERSIADALIKKLQDEDWSVRSRAASALGALGMKERAIADALIKKLQDENASVRSSAASALGALGRKERAIADALIKRLQDENVSVRRSAASALGVLGMKERGIADALVDKLQDEDWSVRRSAASALGALGMKERSIADALGDKLQDENASVRSSAASALGALGMKERSIADALIKKLQDEDWSVRNEAWKTISSLFKET